jgi:hypothetical protein
MLFLPEVSAYKWDKWSKGNNGVWEATNHRAGDKVGRSYCSYLTDSKVIKPFAYLRFTTIAPGQLSLPAASEDLLRFGGYFSLREEIKEWLRRLGVVMETKNQIGFTRELSVTYAIYGDIPFSKDSLSIWHCKPMNTYLAAIKRISLLKGYGNDFTQQADQNDDVRCPLVASLPNGFFLRKMHPGELNPSETPWWEVRITGDTRNPAHRIPAIATIIVRDRGEVEITVEVLSDKRRNFEAMEKLKISVDIATSIDAVLSPYIVSRKVVDHLYTPPEKHQNIHPGYLKLIIEENRIADLQTLISKGNDNVDIDIPSPIPGLLDEDMTTTPLHLAVYRNRLEIAELLLEKTNLRSKINERDVSFGKTPLDIAFADGGLCDQEEKPMVKLLRKYGAKGNPPAREAFSILDWD